VQEVRPAAPPGATPGEGARGASNSTRVGSTHGLCSPSHDGDYFKQGTRRAKHWDPALRAAGVEHRGTYACRHTFAAWSIAAGVQLFYLSRIMGTSVAQIDATYGHLVPDSEEYLRGLLDTYDAAFPAAARSGSR
jgi:integrase